MAINYKDMLDISIQRTTTEAVQKNLEDMLDFLVYKGVIDPKEFEEFMKNRKLIERIY